MSGREDQGVHGVVISSRNASIFGMTVKKKIRCGSGGVKNGLNGSVMADYPESGG